MLIRILLAFLCLLLPVNADAVMFIGAGGGDTYSDITLWVNAEGTWSAPTYTLGATEYVCAGCDNTLTANSDIAQSDAAEKNGTYGFTVPGASDYFSIDADAGGSADEIINRGEGQIGFWLYITTGVASIKYIDYVAGDSYIDILAGTSSATDIRIRYCTDGSVVAAATEGGLIAEDTWYFVVGKWKTATDNLGIYVYDTNGDLVDSNTNNPPATITDTTPTLTIGNNTAGAGAYYMDTIMVTNDYARDLVALRNTTNSPR